MNKKSKSKIWFQKHINDPFVKEAQQAGYRSRASFKLIEIQNSYKLIKQRQTVCDLGAAPGGWSELAKKWVGPKGKLIACDLLEINPLDGVIFIQGDFTSPETQQQICEANDNQKLNAIISDMAPDTMGHQATDQLRSIGLVEQVLHFSKNNLAEDGACIVKVFQGVGFDQLVKDFRLTFKKVIIKKPKASKDASKEVYLVAQNLKKII
ncbi:MAG: RlmE family RNA methyltransferase [Legionellales bacterium]|nr:RlmE family RNA methyltransferase [Legionellales bacterium]